MKNIEKSVKENLLVLEKSLSFRKIPQPLDFTKVTGLFINGTCISIYGIDNKTVDK